MPSLNVDLVKRVQRLPKPSNASGALIPLFEAVSNSIHSVQARFKLTAARRGRITVEIVKRKGRRPMSIIVSDNGLGLDEKNFKAFCTTDTDNKIEIGGKGVGRLMWLSSFNSISVSSTYKAGKTRRTRKFDFVLANDDQLKNYSETRVADDTETGMTVTFSDLQQNGYAEKFPVRLGYVFQHFTSHFLPTFISGKCPEITLIFGDETRVYPEAVSTYIRRQETVSPLKTTAYGDLRFIMMECDKVASSDLKGTHFVHFIAHDRTVRSQKIDAKLGIKYFGESDSVFHACLFGPYLNKSVNQERTSFTFEDSVLEDIINTACMPHISRFLAEPISTQRETQGAKIDGIVETYPSVAFGSVEELRTYVPLGELADDAIFGHLSRERYRRDARQAEKIRSALTRLKGDKLSMAQFDTVLAEAASALEDTSQKSLAEYVVRRKVVLDFLRVLVEKISSTSSDASYQREDALHSFICPMRISTVGKAKEVTPAASHELWVVDERLTFAQYFSSDVAFSALEKAYESDDRPDLILFDKVHGLRESDDSSKIMLVEFKRPGRKDYDDAENPQFQVQRYVETLLRENEVDVAGRPIRLKRESTTFYCYIIADRVGKMRDWTYSWSHTADGRGRLYQPREGYNGSIELIEWDALLDDATLRNKAFFDKAGISGESLFSQRPTKS